MCLPYYVFGLPEQYEQRKRAGDMQRNNNMSTFAALQTRVAGRMKLLM
jgi:hypothetical protein